MRLLIAILGLLLLTAALPVQAAAMPDLPFTKMQLRNGQEVSGRLAVRPRGLYLSTAVGGTLYTWQMVVPASLPEDVRTAHRAALLVKLSEAQTLYAARQVERAVPLFAEVYRERDYLTDADRQLPAYQDLAEKAQGNILVDGLWLSYTKYQLAQGLVQVDGQWRTASEAQQIAAFKRAFAIARGADQPEDGIVALKQVMARYPTSPYNDVAKLMIEKLVERAAAQTAAVATAASTAPPAEVEYVRDHPSTTTTTTISTGPSLTAGTYYGTNPADYLDWNRPQIVFDKQGNTIYVGGWQAIGPTIPQHNFPGGGTIKPMTPGVVQPVNPTVHPAGPPTFSFK